jgi:small-conductance mechanosensitive channel
VRTEDYWSTLRELTQAVKKGFDEEGISIPFPQRDVHVIQHKAGQSSRETKVIWRGIQYLPFLRWRHWY